MSTQTLNIALPTDLLKKADQVAKKEYRSRSELIREALRLYLEEKSEWQEIFRLGEKTMHEMNIKNGDDIDKLVYDYRHNPKKVNVVLDTNVIISALGFGGKPREILILALEKHINGISSPILFAELEDVIFKKFPQLSEKFERINYLLRKQFHIVRPKQSLHIIKDDADNRVLEAAIAGKCNYIITGDRDLLELETFKEIRILKPNDFLNEIGS